MIRINSTPIGRLGNQLFIIAATLGYALKHGAEWGFPSNTKEVPNLRKFFPKIPVLDGHFKRFNRTDPSQFNYEEFPKFNQDTTLVGFFQSLKYFEHCQDEVKKLFKLDINPINGISIHIRRTDYVTHSNSFPPITTEYIKLAIENLESMGIDCHNLYIFSDDIEWAKQHANEFMFGYKHAFFMQGNEFEDLSNMASCEHHIIANSTFSHWGAYLGHNPNKIVISPDPSCWFGPGFTGSVPKDLIPDEWTKIKFR
jgi:hypothetical protein